MEYIIIGIILAAAAAVDIRREWREYKQHKKADFSPTVYVEAIVSQLFRK